MADLLDFLSRYGTLSWRSRWYAAAAVWLVCLAGWTAVALLPSQYEATARVYIDADAVLTPLLRGITVDSSLNDQIDLLQTMMLSRPNLERIISKTDLQLRAGSRNDMERMVLRLARTIKVTPASRNIFAITYRDGRRQLAYDVVQAVLASFIENKAGDNREEMEKASAFLDSQIDIYERQLRQAETRRAEFRRKYVDVLPGDGGQSRLEQARATVVQVAGQLADARQRRVLLAQELGSTRQTVPTDEGGGVAPSTALRDAQERLRSLQQVYTEQYPEVVSQRRLVESLQRAGPAQPAAASGRSEPNPVYEQLKIRLVETDESIGSLSRQFADAVAERDRLDAIARGAPGLEAQYVNLNRDYDVIRKNYDELIGRREGMRISTKAEVSSSNVKMVIIDPPMVPEQPVAPARVIMAFGVLVSGLAAGFGVLMTYITMDTSFHDVAQARALGLPILGSVTLAAKPVPAAQRLRWAASYGASFAALVLVFMLFLLRMTQRI